MSEKVAFDDFDLDSIQKTPEKKTAKEEAAPTTIQRKYELRANNSFISPIDRQEN